MNFNYILAASLLFSSSIYSIDNTKPVISTNATPSTSHHFDNLPQEHPELSTFVMLVNKAELKDLFNGTGPFTIFAPTDEAFKKLGQKKIDELSKPEQRDELSEILLYHALPGKYLSKNLKTKEFPSINGKPVKISVEGEEIRVNNAKVLKTDIVGPNGVIHEVDTVLIP